jgi:hypothetical protein
MTGLQRRLAWLFVMQSALVVVEGVVIIRYPSPIAYACAGFTLVMWAYTLLVFVRVTR